MAQPNRDKGFIYEPNPPFLVKIVEGIEVITQPLLVGDDYATAWSESKYSDGSRTILITVAYQWAKNHESSTGSANDALETIKAAQNKSLESMEGDHRAWWHRFYQASFVSFPDARLENFYWISAL